MNGVCISGSGLYAPAASILNEELVAAYNTYAEHENAANSAAIAAGDAQPLPLSSTESIIKVSGIRSRHVVDREGVLESADDESADSSAGQR